uniref:Putative exosomal 3'-5' exoribonuclease complex subunit n=2 Tax=Ixodes ricinus TaxID=34613 RepID=V5GGL2_IXORI
MPPTLPVPPASPVAPALPVPPASSLPDTTVPTSRTPRKRSNKKKKKNKQGSPISSGGTASLRKESQYEHVTVADMLRHPQWKRFVQCTGRVVHILEAKNSRVAAGTLRLLQDRNPAWLLFSPKDSRFPRMLIPSAQAPPGFFERPTDFSQTLFLAEMTKWLPDSTFAQGQLRRLLGQAGDLEVETEAILESYEVDHGEFPPDILAHLDQSWKVPEEELSRRRDFRNELVFTVDPKTARDLDDALSCRPLDDGALWEVGVHIADVSHFVLPGTKLDQVALRRATSVYLVQQVVPMLPRLLCDQLCSLHPGEDKLTFSVVWTMTRDGRVLDEWFGRSVIRSCAKLSYEHAQDLMDDPDREHPEGELPELHGAHTWAQVAQALGVLKDMTRAMRSRRFDGGALRLDQVRVAFSLNQDFQPVGFSVYEHTESHRLIEELMLLANMAVAHRLYKAFPEQAFLRSHPPPDEAQLTEVTALCTAHGISLDTSSAGALQRSLNQLLGSDEASHARLNVLTNLLSRPMKMATYFCAGRRDDPDTFWHYALNVPLYTHFTSPIRRYADIVVHRLLGAALGYSEPLRQSPKELQGIAEHCNDKKFKARNVQDLSIELFLYVFIQQCGKFEDRAMVTSVQEHAFDVLSLSVGMVKRVYCDKLGVKSFSHSTEGGRNCIELRYQSADGVSEVTDTIGVFKLVDIVIVAMPREPLKYQVVLKPPVNTVPVPPKKEDRPFKGKQFSNQKRIPT